jgi:hypothetical protein
MATCHSRNYSAMSEINCEKKEGKHVQMNFDQFLQTKAEIEPIKIYPPVCPLCGWESPDHDPQFHCGKRQNR